jgi:ubiquinone/menaquinone biosynthesis C-methylase UbiE
VVAFQELKERQSFVWGNAPFEKVADSIADVHQAVVEGIGAAEGKRWLDVACGTGELARIAAQTGADVVGVDFAPVLVETAKRQASDAGLAIDFRVGDAESLEFEDASFDVVSSTFGVMFAPDQAAAASELVRVTKPRGRLGLATWTPDGGIGQMFKMTAAFQPPLPEGVGAPLDWGRRERLKELLGDAFDLEIEERVTTHTADSAEAYWQIFATNFGPVKTLYDMLDDDRREEFHRAFIEFLEDDYTRPDGSVAHTRDYLLTTGTRR